MLSTKIFLYWNLYSIFLFLKDLLLHIKIIFGYHEPLHIQIKAIKIWGLLLSILPNPRYPRYIFQPKRSTTSIKMQVDSYPREFVVSILIDSNINNSPRKRIWRNLNLQTLFVTISLVIIKGTYVAKDIWRAWEAIKWRKLVWKCESFNDHYLWWPLIVFF